MNDENIIKGICAAVVIIMVIYYLKRKEKIRSVMAGAVTGLAALFLLNFFGEDFGLSIPLNLFNISGSVVLGVPFVIFLTIMNYF